jgi:predicted PurR-regulated permease PerM
MATRATDDFSERVLVATGIVVAVVLLVLLAIKLAQVLLLVFGAGLFAILLDGLASLLRRWVNLSRTWSLVATVAVLLLLVGVGIWLGGDRIAEEATQFQERLPAAVEGLRDKLMQYGWFRTLWRGAPSLEQIAASGTGLIGGLGGVFASTLGGIGGFLLALVIGLYLVFEPNVYRNGVLALVPRAHRARGREVLAAITLALRSWLVARFASMGIVGILTTIGVMIVGLPMALILGLITALLSFIPFIGPIVAAVPAILLALVESPTTALWITGVYVAVQVVEENLIAPLIERRAVRLPPGVILASQLVMGVVFGFAGVVLSTPLAVVFIVLVQTLYVQDVLDEPAKVLGPK